MLHIFLSPRRDCGDGLSIYAQRDGFRNIMFAVGMTRANQHAFTRHAFAMAGALMLVLPVTPASTIAPIQTAIRSTDL